MGWNSISDLKGPLFGSVSEGSFMYFVHSYYVPLSQNTAATCSYGGIEFSAALAKDNFMGTQFHPEKSGSSGERILSAFLEDL